MGIPVPIIDSLIEFGGGIIKKMVKDKYLAEKLNHEFRMFFTGKDFETLLGQMEINKVEAAHKSVFVAGWRPFVGWVCGVSLAYNFIVYPLMLWIAWLFPEYQSEIQSAPKLEVGELMVVLTGMLGLSATRSYDKKNKVQTDSLSG